MLLLTLYFTTTSKPFFFKKFSSIAANVVSSSTKRILAMGKRLNVQYLLLVYRTVKTLFYFIDNGRGKFTCFQQLSIGHLIKKVNRYGLIQNRLFQCGNNKLGSFAPTYIVEEHHPAQYDGRRVHAVRVGEARRRAMRCLKNGMSGLVVDIRTGCDTNATNNCRKCIRNVISVQI